VDNSDVNGPLRRLLMQVGGGLMAPCEHGSAGSVYRPSADAIDQILEECRTTSTTPTTVSISRLLGTAVHPLQLAVRAPVASPECRALAGDEYYYYYFFVFF